MQKVPLNQNFNSSFHQRRIRRDQKPLENPPAPASSESKWALLVLMFIDMNFMSGICIIIVIIIILGPRM